MKNKTPSSDKDQESRDEAVDGASIAAKILMRMPQKSQDRIVQAMKQQDPAIAAKVDEKLTRFEEIASLTPQSLQALLREVEHRDVIKSLTRASNDVQSAVMQSISGRARETIQEDLKATQAQALSAAEIEEARRRIVLKLDELRAVGKIRSQETSGRWA